MTRCTICGKEPEVEAIYSVDIDSYRLICRSCNVATAWVEASDIATHLWDHMMSVGKGRETMRKVYLAVPQHPVERVVVELSSSGEMWEVYINGTITFSSTSYAIASSDFDLEVRSFKENGYAVVNTVSTTSPAGPPYRRIKT